jgi:hypothetical protein
MFKVETKRVSGVFDYFTGLGHRTPSKHLSELGLIRTGKPVVPHVAGLIASLILDSCAATQAFSSWCDAFGYDTDSRKALAAYEGCQENAVRFNAVFTNEQQAKLAELLQDY